jgi:DNA-directed RNA polymerase beta' subunit
MGLILDLSPRSLEKVLYFASYIVLDAGKTELQYKQILTEKEYQEIEKKAALYNLRIAKYVRLILTETELKIKEFATDKLLLEYGNNFIRIKNLLRHREFSQLDHTKVILREVEIVTKLIYEYLYNKMNTRTEENLQEDE